MSKIFRLHKGGADTIVDWAPINGHLSDTFIKTIDDPAGENSKKQITSIPSPFARMDLVRIAAPFFGQVASLFHYIVPYLLVQRTCQGNYCRWYGLRC